MERKSLLLVVGIIIIASSIVTMRRRRKLISNGLRAEGIVYGITRESNSTVDGIYPTIRFLTIKNEWITEAANTGVVFGTYKLGSKVNVIYDPENPKKFIMETKSPYVISYITLSAGIILTLFAAYQLLW